MENLNDENLVELVQKGDIEMFGSLVERYEQKMLRYAGRFLFDHDNAQDAVQEVFIKAYTNIASFDLTKRFSPWLYRIAHNYFINEIKKKGREPIMSFDADIFLPKLFFNNDPEKDILDKELKELLDLYINKINSKYKEVLILYYFEDLSYREISDILHIPLSAVGIRLNRGKKAMQKIIKI